MGYRGCKAKSKSGKRCRAWKSSSSESGEVTSSKYPGKGLEGGHNYCRNPNGETGIWCYTSDSISSKEFCSGADYFEWKRGARCGGTSSFLLAKIPGKQVGECGALCDQTPGCQDFGYDEDQQRCDLWKANCEPWSYTQPAYHTWRRKSTTKCPQGKQCGQSSIDLSYWIHTKKIDLFGNDIASSMKTTIQSCIDWCQQDPSCLAAMYKKSHYWCWKKSVNFKTTKIPTVPDDRLEVYERIVSPLQVTISKPLSGGSRSRSLKVKVEHQQCNKFEWRWGQGSGCTSTDAGLRMAQTQAGSFDKYACADKCIAAGATTCNNFEVLSGSCKHWAGSCTFSAAGDRDVYVPNHSCDSTKVNCVGLKSSVASTA